MYIVLSLILLSAPILQALVPRTAQAASTNLVISEVAPDGSTASQEFVELYNNSDSDVVVQGWSVQLRSATGGLNRTLSFGDKVVRARSFALFASTGYSAPCAASDFTCFSATMSASGGQVVLLNANGAVVDKLGWGTATDSENSPAATPLFNAASMTRKSVTTNVLQDTDNNSNDFESFTAHTPTGGGTYTYVPVVDVCPNIDGAQTTVPSGYELVGGQCQVIVVPPPATLIPSCSSISITEILPNPAGDDSGKEYVELFNAASIPVDLTGCILKVGTAQQVLSGFMNPGYKAFYGLTLPNSAGGQVQFITNTQTLSVTYPANLKDDEAYGLVSGEWKQGLVPTPGAANIDAVLADTSAEAENTEPCPEGKYRNPETGRCKNIEGNTAQAACAVGQVRNPETNRCRNAATAAATVTACQPGESRNPETNRCRKNTSTSSTQTPCQAGQERNPETNRCRKVLAAKSTNPMSKTDAAASKPISYLVLGVVAALALGYAGYEYRQSIYNFFVRRRKSLPQS